MDIIEEVKARNHFYKKELDFVITKLKQKKKNRFPNNQKHFTFR